MKKILTILLLLLTFSCSEEGGGTGNEDSAPTVTPIADITVDFGTADQTIQLSSFFSDTDGDAITFSAVSSNTTSVSVILNGSVLTVSFGETGTADVTITATANGKSASDIFRVTVGSTPDNAPILAQALSGFSANLNHADTVISLIDVFTDEDGDVFSYIASSSNTSVITTAVSGSDLTLSFVAGAFGTADISVTASANGVTVNDSFTITVNDNSSSILTDAETSFSSGNYTEAIEHFEQLITHSDNDVKADAYTGLGYSLMRTESISDAYDRFKSGVELGETTSTNDVKSGLCFLELTLKDDFNTAITLGKEILASTSGFQMKYDSNIDHKDIRLTVAQSYFGLNDYEKCLVEVQALGKMANDSATDLDIETKLLSVLKELADELN